MRDISMHVLDIAMNSIKANATVIKIMIIESDETIRLIIKDNGCGMDKETLNSVVDPFFTTRKTRNVGLGIPLLYQNVKRTSGKFNITSSLKLGTAIEAIFNRKHIDCIPLGDINETIISLILLEPLIDFIYTRKNSFKKYVLNTKKIKRVLNGVKINEKEVIDWLKADLLNFSMAF